MNSDSFKGAVRELRFAFEKTEFMRQHLSAAGMRPEDIQTPEQFRCIPVTRKVDYRANFPAGVMVEGVKLSDPLLHKSQSSGTGGDRLVTVTTRFDLAKRMRSTISVNPTITGALHAIRDQRVCRYAAPNCSDVECASPLVTTEDRILPDKTLVLPVAHDLLATPKSMIEQAIVEINSYKPHWLYIDPTHLSFLIRNLIERGESIPLPCAVVLTYTMATASARRQLADYFPLIPMAEVVSMSEFGWIAMECERGTLHLNTSSFYCELLDSRGYVVEEGNRGVLHITSLGDRVLPHVRYETGDVYTLLGACECGHKFPAVRFEGRMRDMIVRNERLVSPKEIDRLVSHSAWLDVYKFVQLSSDSFAFRFIPSKLYRQSCEEEIRSALSAALGDNARIEIELTDYLPTDRSGKFSTCNSMTTHLQS